MDPVSFFKKVRFASNPNVNLTFDGLFFTLIFDGGGLILSTLFQFVKTIEKVIF